MTTETVEVRCPNGNRRMFGKMLVDSRLANEHPQVVEGNLVEVACSECKRDFRLRGDKVTRVLHRYNILGELIESETVR